MTAKPIPGRHMDEARREQIRQALRDGKAVQQTDDGEAGDKLACEHDVLTRIGDENLRLRWRSPFDQRVPISSK